MGYTPKNVIDSDSDGNIPHHIPDLEDYCRTCLSHRVRCTCKPMSNWSTDLIDITQLDYPNTDNNATKNDRDDGQDNPLPSDWSDQDNFGLGKISDKVRPPTLKSVPMPPPIEEHKEGNCNEHLHPHNYRAKMPSQVSPSKPPPGWPKGIRTNPNTNTATTNSPQKPKNQSNIGLQITKVASISKEAFDAFD